MKKLLIIILCLAVSQCGLSPAWAAPVEVPETAPTYVKGGPETIQVRTVRSDASPDYLQPLSGTYVTPSVTPSVPITIQAGSGTETRLGVDLAAADKATEGWPWYGKAAVVVGCVAVVALATWAIVEAAQDGSHDNDSSSHVTIYGDDGSTLNVRIGSDNETRTGY